MSLEISGSADQSASLPQILTDALSGNGQGVPKFNEIFQEISIVAYLRGFNDDEFSLLLQFISEGPFSQTQRSRIVPMLVPCSVAPTAAVKKFLFWFISNYQTTLKMQQNILILKWIIGLLDHDLVDPNVINIFYHGFTYMLRFKELVKYACKLLCKLTQPHDVTLSAVTSVTQKLAGCGDEDDKYLQAVLNVFEGYKPHLMKEAGTVVKKVNIGQVLRSVPKMNDLFIKFRNRRFNHLNQSVRGAIDLLPFSVHNINFNSRGSQYKISSLLPVSTFGRELLDKGICVHPSSIKGAVHSLWNIPVPQDVQSLLRDDVGFFMLMYRGKDVQTRFSSRILSTLEAVFLTREEEASEEDKDFLLTRIYDFQKFMLQGIPSVSVFLAKYLWQWGGLDHRYRILNLIQWVVFDSFQELSSNILHPLYFLFVSSDMMMKIQILDTCTNLITNMFMGDFERSRRNMTHPFTHHSLRWLEEPLTMLKPLIAFVEDLVKVGTYLHPGDTQILMASIHFYEQIYYLELQFSLPMWTVIHHFIVGQILLNLAPVALNRVCRLLLKYHTEFLPRLRENQPEYYIQCMDKIHLTTKYCQDLINLLWNRQAFTRKEDGLFMNQVTDEAVMWMVKDQSLGKVDAMFDVSNHIGFLPYRILEREKRGPQFRMNKAEFGNMLEYHLQDIAEFIKHFSQDHETHFSYRMLESG